MAVSFKDYDNALAQMDKLELDRSNSEKEKMVENKLRPVFEEILKKKNPDNAVYSLDVIQDWLFSFSRAELVDACHDDQKDVADFFKFSDANSDAKISFSEWGIMGFVCAEQESGYGRAKKA
ncbi:hypothetical protein BO71DRAFT_435800 [Aspergillus ellipticus CBS 707.79]|uniref:EF-hand domain-containing protein n=1 Tax=Aspergillus ellipticus CBS 707.79 TaxID=1448320 RepID=A0A319D1J9_9EURO|nr:hypothetical protein BO71DRAFT_435800 [Aspergillus ellipticus CBS 707.79]